LHLSRRAQGSFDIRKCGLFGLAHPHSSNAQKSALQTGLCYHLANPAQPGLEIGRIIGCFFIYNFRDLAQVSQRPLDDIGRLGAGKALLEGILYGCPSFTRLEVRDHRSDELARTVRIRRRNVHASQDWAFQYFDPLVWRETLLVSHGRLLAADSDLRSPRQKTRHECSKEYCRKRHHSTRRNIAIKSSSVRRKSQTLAWLPSMSFLKRCAVIAESGQAGQSRCLSGRKSHQP